MKNSLVLLLAGALALGGCGKTEQKTDYSNPTANNWINPVTKTRLKGNFGKYNIEGDFKIDEKVYEIRKLETYKVQGKEYHLFTIIYSGTEYGVVPVNVRNKKVREIKLRSGRIEEIHSDIFEIAYPEEPIERLECYPTFPKGEKPDTERIKKDFFKEFTEIKANEKEYLISGSYKVSWKDPDTQKEMERTVEDTIMPSWDKEGSLIGKRGYLPITIFKKEGIEEKLDLKDSVLYLYLEEFIAVRIDD